MAPERYRISFPRTLRHACARIEGQAIGDLRTRQTVPNVVFVALVLRYDDVRRAGGRRVFDVKHRPISVWTSRRWMMLVV